MHVFFFLFLFFMCHWILTVDHRIILWVRFDLLIETWAHLRPTLAIVMRLHFFGYTNLMGGSHCSGTPQFNPESGLDGPHLQSIGGCYPNLNEIFGPHNIDCTHQDLSSLFLFNSFVFHVFECLRELLQILPFNGWLYPTFNYC